MPYIPQEIIQQARQLDLLTYLQTYEPQELVHFSGNTYTTRTHDSLKISNGKWMWWSRGIGGRSALDYLIKVRGYSFMEAVEIIAGQMVISSPICAPKVEKSPKEKSLLLPEVMVYPDQVYRYLQNRGIAEEVIEYCIDNKLIFESVNYHNAIFVGYDRAGKMRYAAMRGTRSSFLGDATGSDKRYSFKIEANSPCDRVHLFESAIDLLSYATLEQMAGHDWRREHLLSLAGVYQPAKEIKNSKVPAAVSQFLEEHPEVGSIVAHLDNDQAGRRATEAIRLALVGKVNLIDYPPKCGKDYNDMLCMQKGLEITKRQKVPKDELSRGNR